MNVFQMYVENGNRAGFWIRRNSWGNTAAFVLSVQGKREGDLEGVPPYYGDPLVVADVYDLHRPLLKELHSVVRCPGTYTYQRFAGPSWAKRYVVQFGEDFRGGEVW